MAHLPAPTLESSPKALDALAVAIHSGKSPGQIARILAPNDKATQKHLRGKIREMTYSNADLHTRVAQLAQGRMLRALGPAVEALARRAERGNPQAIKLLFEASGFHNPKVDHKHSGEISIKLDMPRPAKVEDDVPVDAEVVED